MLCRFLPLSARSLGSQSSNPAHLLNDFEQTCPCITGLCDGADINGHRPLVPGEDAKHPLAALQFGLTDFLSENPALGCFCLFWRAFE